MATPTQNSGTQLVPSSPLSYVCSRLDGFMSDVARHASIWLSHRVGPWER